MTQLKIDALKPGMVLARTVYNQQDLLLLEKGTALTRKRIWMLKTWGIDQVSIKGDGQEDVADVDEVEVDSYESIEKELLAKFADVLDDPIMEKIMQAAARQLQKGLAHPDKQNETT